ncbi:MAG: aminoacyl-histidine dipeptidase [Phycisphaerae bacterium]
MSFVSELEPLALWKHFDEILKVPRGSKDEGRIRDYVIGVVKQTGLPYKVDAAGNMVVGKPASTGHRDAPIVILQSHLDMVQEKNSDVDHDFDTDAIKPQREGEYVKATGTTLGADNGIGVAAMLAVMEAGDLTHGPLEFLFTIDEESGLTGAGRLADDMLEGELLLNLDSEEEGILTIGCAGGADSHLSLPLCREGAPADSKAVTLRLFGLKGGHSGCDIHLQRGNAIKLLVRALQATWLERPFHLVCLQGGNAHNAIPREATAMLVTSGSEPQSPAQGLHSALKKEFEAIQAEFRSADPGVELAIEDAAVPTEVWDQATTEKVLTLIHGLPHGVIAMSQDIPGLVETSTNLAVVDETGGRFKILMSSRSSEASALQAVRERLRTTGSLAGAEVTEDDGYPGWKPDTNSHLLELVKKVCEEVFGRTPEVSAMHAGLECGIIGEKYPGMDMISFGPQIDFPHSPDERVKIDTVGPFYKLLTTTLQRLV